MKLKSSQCTSLALILYFTDRSTVGGRIANELSAFNTNPSAVIGLFKSLALPQTFTSTMFWWVISSANLTTHQETFTSSRRTKAWSVSWPYRGGSSAMARQCQSQRRTELWPTSTGIKGGVSRLQGEQHQQRVGGNGKMLHQSVLSSSSKTFLN